MSPIPCIVLRGRKYIGQRKKNADMQKNKKIDLKFDKVY